MIGGCAGSGGVSFCPRVTVNRSGSPIDRARDGHALASAPAWRATNYESFSCVDRRFKADASFRFLGNSFSFLPPPAVRSSGAFRDYELTITLRVDNSTIANGGWASRYGKRGPAVAIVMDSSLAHESTACSSRTSHLPSGWPAGAGHPSVSAKVRPATSLGRDSPCPRY